ncbi:hypothetical protein P67b_00056 [Ruegeria phage Tedan]|nr:hypothetical protein P67b_00056 [Ruegeria phage Tedan]
MTDASERTPQDVFRTIEAGEFYKDYDQSASDLGVLREKLLPQWRPVIDKDLGTERLVKHASLVDMDFNTEGVVVATISGEKEAICAIWNNCQDCWDTFIIPFAQGYQVKEVPYN